MDTKPVRYSWKVIVLIHSLKQKKPGEKTHILGRVLQFVFSKVRLSRRQCSDLNAAKIFPGKYLRHYLRPCCKAQRRVSLFQSAARTAFTPPVDLLSPPTAAERPRWRCPSNQAHSTVRPLPFTGERPMRRLYALNIHYISRALRITWSFRAKSDSRPEGEVSIQEAERDARNNGGEWKPLKTHRITCLSGFIVQLKEGEVKIICFTFVVRVSCSF